MSYPVPEITNPIQYYYEQTKYINLNNDSSLFLLPMADFRDFVGAVTWTEGFLVTLMSFQILFLVLVIATRKSQTFQMFLMFAITGLVTSSRKLNSLGQEHWRKFASQNYFDRQGLFMLIFYSGPLMLSATFIMLHTFKVLFEMAVRTKRLQFSREKSGNGITSSKKDQ